MGVTTATSRRKIITGTLSITTLLSVTLGCFFLIVMLAFAVFFPNPPLFQQKVFISVLSLAAGAFGAIIPGFFEIRFRGFIRASGAAAFAAMIYLVQPAIVENVATLVTPNSAAEPVALDFLDAVDRGEVEASWHLLDAGAAGLTVDSLSQWRRIYENYRRPLGNAANRALIGESTMRSPQGFPVGLYQLLIFRTKFSNVEGCRSESVMMRADQQEQWRVFSYLISPTDVPCL